MSRRIRAGFQTLLVTGVLVNAPVSAAPAATTAGAEGVTPVGAQAPRPVLERIAATLKERIPDLTVLDVYTSPVAGLYEVLAPDGLIYIDATGDHIFMGPLIDTHGRQNLTQPRFITLTSIDFDTLPFDLAIKEVRGDGTRRIAVFADPKCPYCQQLEGELGKLDNITVYTFLYPLEDLHPGATEQAHRIWCAPDRSGAWTDWMRSKKAVPVAAAACTADPVRNIDQLGHKLHLNSTPTIFFESGKRLTGVLQESQFQHLLETESAHPPAPAVTKAGP